MRGTSSAVTRMPRLFASRTMRTEPSVEMCATWYRAPTYSASGTSRAASSMVTFAERPEPSLSAAMKCMLSTGTLLARLSPPVALSAYFLKGVVPDWDLADIYAGMMQFMVLQVIGLLLLLTFPQLALWLPAVLRD